MIESFRSSNLGSRKAVRFVDPVFIYYTRNTLANVAEQKSLVTGCHHSWIYSTRKEIKKKKKIYVPI